MDIATNDIEMQNKSTCVVLIHGLTGAPIEMKPLEKYIRKLGFDVESVLLAGHGAGYQEVYESSWTEWIESVRAAVKQCLQTHDQVIIAGLSMGAVIGSLIASEEPRVAGLVMLSPTLRYDGSVLLNSVIDWVYHSDAIVDAVRFAIRLVPAVGKCYWEELPPYGIRDERIQRQITKSIEAAKESGNNEFGSFRTYYKNLAEMITLVNFARQRFFKVTCPTLLVHSFDDTLASVGNSTRCYLEMGSTNKALMLISGCDHVMTLDLQKHLVHKTVGRFVQNFASAAPQFKTVRELIAPVLSEARFAKEATITSTISPEIHGLSRDEWQQVYPGKRFAHMAPVSDVDQLHSIVVRDKAQTIFNLPLFIGSYQQSAKASNAPLQGLLGKALLGRNATVLGIGSLSHEVPGFGISQDAPTESKSYAHACINRIIASLAKSAKVHAISSVEKKLPELPPASIMVRASDNQPIEPDKGIERILSGTSTFHHLSPVLNALSRSIEVALPQARSISHSDELILDEVAVG